MTTPPYTTDPILLSYRLGWLAVESFGLLRRYALHGKPPSPQKIDASRRFNFIERDPNLYEQLLISMLTLKATAARLVPSLPPPLPADPVDLFVQVKSDRQSLDRVWGEFERWSQEVWNALQIQGSLIGQAFAYGGDLAATYWYTQEGGVVRLAEMLRSYRLDYVAERLEDLTDYLPQHAALVIHHSLEHWSIGEEIKGMDETGQNRLLERLGAQAKVWRDLLFGLRQADSYLLASDRRRIAWGAAAATALLVVLVGLAVWLAVLLLSAAGRALLASNTSVATQATEASSDLVTQLLNWQNWSALLATLSSVIVVLTGFITRLSGWMIAFHQSVKNWLEFRRIFNRTLRTWRK
jgi:hypothetical protein